MIETDTLRLASAKNYLELVKMMQKRGVDFPKIKTKVGEILARQDLQEIDLAEMLNTLGGITKFIEKEFPHDHAYLLGQALEKKQATCAGKVLMFNMIAENLGLSPIEANVYMTNEGAMLDYLDQHVITQFEIKDYLIEVDLNFYARSAEQKNSNGCLVNILKKVDESKNRPGKKQLRKNNSREYKKIGDRYVEYQLVWGEAPHKFTTGTNFNEAHFELTNYANLLKQEEYQAGFTQEQNKLNLLEAERLYKLEIAREPLTAASKTNLAYLFTSNEFRAFHSEEENNRNMFEAVRLNREAMTDNPFDTIARNNLANILSSKEYQQLFGIDQQLLNLKEAETLYRDSIKLNPSVGIYKDNLAILLVRKSKEYTGTERADYQEAENIYRELMEDYPENEVYVIEFAEMLSSSSYQYLHNESRRKDNYLEAERLYKQVLRRNPQNMNCRIRLLFLYYDARFRKLHKPDKQRKYLLEVYRGFKQFKDEFQNEPGYRWNYWIFMNDYGDEIVSYAKSKSEKIAIVTEAVENAEQLIQDNYRPENHNEIEKCIQTWNKELESLRA